MKIVKATVVKTNKSQGKPTSETYKDFRKGEKGFSMVKKTYSVKFPKSR